MLNTRHGQVLLHGDYGIPDMNDLLHSFPDSIQEMQQAIRTTIEKFEPRLKVINIRFIESEEDILTLRFEIKARLITAKEKAALQFETMVDSSGEVQVTG